MNRTINRTVKQALSITDRAADRIKELVANNKSG